MLKLLLIASGLYLAVLLLFAALQAKLLFPVGAVPAAGSLPHGAQRLATTAPDGARLEGVHIPPLQAPSQRTLAVVFGGNGWNAQHAAELVRRMWPQVDVAAFHYRGYPPSSGSPSAEALLADAPLALAAARNAVRPVRTVAVGMSVGSGVAASLAGSGQVDGAILVTPFDSLSAVARGHYPWLPVDLLFRHEIAAAAALCRSRVPVALIAAERDRIIPAERTAALRRSVSNLAFDRMVPGAGHNDLYDRPQFHHAMNEALAAVLARTPGR
jgi:pimeloyl-ACP methyl ester carboxylesterase